MKIKALILMFTMVLIPQLFAENLMTTMHQGHFYKVSSDNDSGRKEPQTLLGSNKIHFSGYGGPYVAFSRISGEDAVLSGGKGGAVINDTFVFGGGGVGLCNLRKRYDLSDSQYTDGLDYVDFGYGGFYTGFHFFSKSLINFSLTALIGGGSLVLQSTSDEYDDESGQNEYKSSEFFVFEPMLMAHINVTRWFRIGAGASYRYTKGVDIAEFSDDDFRSISGLITFDFGWF
jgi:hypothetical protein